MKKKIVSAVTVLLGLTLAGCGNGQEASSASEAGVETIEVAAGNAYNPFTYLDEDGELDGYDIAVLKAVDEKLEQYEFTYSAYEFKTILPTLDSGQARIGTHQFTKNPEREENYLFGNENFTEFGHYLLTLEDNAFDPQTLDDLVGHPVYLAAGTNYAALLEEYNKNNSEQIDVTFGEMSTDVISQEVISGSADATIVSEIDVVNFNEQYGDVFKKSDEAVHVSETFFVYSKDDEKLRDDVDQALVELKEEGVLDQLADQYIRAEE